VQLVVGMRKYEPLKTGYMDRLRATAPRQASRADVLTYAKALEAAIQRDGP
jgi:hypothetical protein